MANVKDFKKGDTRVAFRAGTETLQAFNIKDALTNSFGKMGMSLPTDLSNINGADQR